jgi:hypothetical protein
MRSGDEAGCGPMTEIPRMTFECRHCGSELQYIQFLSKDGLYRSFPIDSQKRMHLPGDCGKDELKNKEYYIERSVDCEDDHDVAEQEPGLLGDEGTRKLNAKKGGA